MSNINRMTEIGQLLTTQNGRCTEEPLFVVFQKHRVYRVDPDDADGFKWYTSEDFDDVSYQKATALERKYEDEGEEPEGFCRVTYKDIDDFVTVCLTEQGAKNYLKINGHNLSSPRIYAASAWRNQEMIDVRAYLKTLAASQP